jgi:hypothetical protein
LGFDPGIGANNASALEYPHGWGRTSIFGLATSADLVEQYDFSTKGEFDEQE